MERQYERELRQYVIDNFLFGQGGSELKNDDSFMERGIVDSTGVLELVAFLEEKFQVKVEDEDLIPANLDSINNLLLYLNKKQPLKKSNEFIRIEGLAESA
jgi:acyl carrier protein